MRKMGFFSKNSQSEYSAKSPEMFDNINSRVVDDLKTIRKNPPAYIALKNLTYAATNTVARIGGSFFGDGLVSALTNPSERVERIESILRK